MTSKESFAETDQQRLGVRVREAREFLGLSQEEVAKALEIPRASVSAMEGGKRKVSSLELRDLAALYRTTVDRLLGTETPTLEELLDDSARSLFRATKHLTKDERERVVQFAQFLRSAGRAPAPQEGD